MLFLFFKKRLSVIWGLFFILPLSLAAQKDTTLLNEVVVAAPLIPSSLLMAPTAISVINAVSIQPATTQLSLKEYLGQIPGLFAQNQFNYNQDLRIAIRGFGARAAFGIRGVQIIIDGIPETTPDGQGQLDNLPLGLINKIEVLRGPSGALYGNAAGGVLLINTIDSLVGQKVILRATGGAFGLASRQAILGLQKEKFSSVIFYNHTQSRGYRDQSSFKQEQFNAKLAYRLSKNQQLRWQFNLTDSPYAQDPGSLTLEAAQKNPRAGRDANIQYKTSEKINHLKTGLSHSYTKELLPGKEWQLNSYVFGAKRDFKGSLPFRDGGVSAFARTYYGFGSQAQIDNHSKTVFGLGHAVQLDLRSRYENLQGQLGPLTERQKESYENTHGFLSNKTPFGKFSLASSLRYDHIKMGLKDLGLFKNYNAWSPSVSLGYSLKANQFINFQYAQSFETPTLSEAANAPDGSLGFNTELKPTIAKSYEVIYRGKKNLQQGFLRWELAGFISQSSQELLPYELAIYPQRQFYKNMGRTLRKGVETQLSFVSSSFELSSAYTFAHYTFQKGGDLDAALSGNKIPGIPDHHWNSNVSLGLGENSRISLQYAYIGRMLANNSNSVAVASYGLAHMNAYKNFVNAWGNIRLFGGIQNLGNTSYFDNIRINAFGGRFYEAAPTRNFYIGLEVSM